MRVILFIPFLMFVFGCRNGIEQKRVTPKPETSIQKDIPDTTNNPGARVDFIYYLYKNKLTERLALNNIEKGVDSFELRFWSIGSLFDPVILYVLKGQNGSWTNFHYQVYRGDSWNDLGKPKVDSLVVESVKPQQMGWAEYIKRLNIDSLWMMPSQWAVVGKDFGAVDGYCFLVELADNKRYKFLHYYVPDFLQDKEPNHRRIMEFQKQLRDNIIYKGIINP